MSDHERGCQGREYTCTCGYDAERDALIKTLVAALEESAQRNVYDGDYFHDIGLSERMRASWNAEKQARVAIAAAKETTQ